MAPIDTAVLAELLQQAVAEGKHPTLTVTSNSMAPLLHRGDQVQIEAAALERLEPGDIIVMAGAGQLLTHRYWGKLKRENRWWLVTRGDRPLSFDDPWPPGQLVGRVIARRRNGQVLNLASGRGRWLNRMLLGLASRELEWLDGKTVPVSPSRQLLADAGYPPQTSYSGRRVLSALFRRALYLVAWLMTAAVSWHQGNPDRGPGSANGGSANGDGEDR